MLFTVFLNLAILIQAWEYGFGSPKVSNFPINVTIPISYWKISYIISNILKWNHEETFLETAPETFIAIIENSLFFSHYLVCLHHGSRVVNHPTGFATDSLHLRQQLFLRNPFQKMLQSTQNQNQQALEHSFPKPDHCCRRIIPHSSWKAV